MIILLLCLPRVFRMPYRRLTVKHHVNGINTVGGSAFSINGEHKPGLMYMLPTYTNSLDLMVRYSILLVHVYALRLPHGYGHVPGSIFLHGALLLCEPLSTPVHI